MDIRVVEANRPVVLGRDVGNLNGGIAFGLEGLGAGRRGTIGVDGEERRFIDLVGSAEEFEHRW